MNIEIADELERKCVAVRRRGNVVYMYPFDKDVFKSGTKVCTRTGATVKEVKVAKDYVRSDEIVTGLLGGKRLTWDINGKFKSPYVDHDNDLFIPERYWDPKWKAMITLSNLEWTQKFGRRHPYAELPTEPEPDLSFLDYEI